MPPKKARLRLTEREWEIVKLFSRDASVSDIAENLDINRATVNQAIRRVMKRNGLTSRLALIRAYESPGPVVILTPAELRMHANHG